MPNPQAEGPPLVGSPRLFIQHIRSYPTYLEAISSIRNLRTRHVVVTSGLLNVVSDILIYIKVSCKLASKYI
jgi:hypothetical protein